MNIDLENRAPNSESSAAAHANVHTDLLPPQPTLSREEMHAVLMRNSVGQVHHKVAAGAFSASRVRYARDGSLLYIPAWTGIEAWYAARLPSIECHISEVDFHYWRYVRLRGEVTTLYPTGAPHEREAWRKGINALRHTITDMAPIDELALANFGIVQMDIEVWDGTAVSLEESPRAASPAGIEADS